MITLQDAVDDLYRIAIVDGNRTSTQRLALLADMCIEQLDQRGIPGAVPELSVPGIGRSKSWDVGWPPDGKVRLGISLKSLLSNIAGTVPNRVDDLQGEMANVQLLSPEIVTGYIMIFDLKGSKGGTRKDGVPWVDVFRDAVTRLSGRNAPAWAAGMVEASAVIEVDFSQQARIVASPDMGSFFDQLAERVQERHTGGWHA